MKCCPEIRFIDDAQESRFQGSKRSNMDSDVLPGGPSANVQQICFQTAKLSVMVCDELQAILLADCQEWRIVAAKRSDKSSTIL